MAQKRNNQVANGNNHADILADMFATLLPPNFPESYRTSQTGKYRIQRPSIFRSDSVPNTGMVNNASVMEIELPLDAAPQDIVPLIDRQLGAHVTYALLHDCCSALVELCDGNDGEEFMAVFTAAAKSEKEHRKLISAIRRNSDAGDLPSALTELQSTYFQIEEMRNDTSRIC